MDKTIILELMKARIGINGNFRDAYLTAIIEGVLEELEDEKGIKLVAGNMNHTMFAVDYATWRYQNRDGTDGLPKNLEFRLRNLFIHNGVGKSGV